MMTYESFIRSVKINSITGQSSDYVNFLISIKNGRFVLIDTDYDYGFYEYKYIYEDFVIFSFKYKYTPYDCVISDYFLEICQKKYKETYNTFYDEGDSDMINFHKMYIMEYLGYNDFTRE